MTKSDDFIDSPNHERSQIPVAIALTEQTKYFCFHVGITCQIQSQLKQFTSDLQLCYAELDPLRMLSKNQPEPRINTCKLFLNLTSKTSYKLVLSGTTSLSQTCWERVATVRIVLKHAVWIQGQSS